MWDQIWRNARLATMSSGEAYGTVEAAALAVSEGRIVWLGREADLPGPPAKLAHEVSDLEGRWITPGLIDCHTHLVYAGDRAREFELRLGGASYEELARAGGGIRSTVAATRAADEPGLLAASLPRLDALLREGVTTIEMKSGYGLNLENELKQLSVARKLGRKREVEVRTTYLAAHAIPPEYEGRSGDYIKTVVAAMPEVAASGLVDAVDAFCEKIGFTPEETASVFEAAKRAGLAVKLHADQLSDLGGAALAARFGALSADHLEYTNDEGVASMARAGTVAVLLPGAFYFLRETKLPPIASFRRAGVPIALATDCNPGSAPVTSLLLMLNMGCTFFRMTPEEALQGVTCHAAKALGIDDRLGTLEVGKQADLAIWNIETPAELAYHIARNPLHACIKAGKPRVQPM